jgi:hypothetical protein
VLHRGLPRVLSYPLLLLSILRAAAQTENISVLAFTFAIYKLDVENGGIRYVEDRAVNRIYFHWEESPIQ